MADRPKLFAVSRVEVFHVYALDEDDAISRYESEGEFMDVETTAEKVGG